MTELTADEQQVLDRIDVDEIVALTQALVAAPGVNPPGGEGDTAQVLVEASRERGLDVTVDEVEPHRPNVAATLRGGDEPGLLLLGHSDVVPHGDGWTVDPLGGLVRDGRVYGRGSTDMLGGLAASVVAMSALRSSGVELRGSVQLAAVVDEEETGKGIRQYLKDSGGIGYGSCIVAEPTDLQPIIAARGDSYLEIEVTGRSAHSGNPSDGVSAIYGAAAIVAEIEAWHHEMAETVSHPLVGPPTWNVGQVSGGLGTSTVPAECRLMVDRRLMPDEDGAVVLAATRERLLGLGLNTRGLGVEIAMTMEMPGFETPSDDPFVAAVDAALGAAGGPGLPLAGWSAACDGGFIA
ncbi:MAG: M20 family metallopeptidase, partial [Nocardioidaceae bacterium]